MEEQPGTGKQKTQRKRILTSSFCFVAGWIMLLLMAIMWSLDVAFIYFCLSLALIFFIAGYALTSLSPPTFRDFQEKHNTMRGDTVSSRDRRQPFQSTNRKAKLAFIVLGGFFMFGILLFILSAAFTSSESTADEDVTIAGVFYGSGEYDSAQMWFRSALRKEPENVQALVGYGNTIWSMNNIDSALILFDKAISIDSNNEYARYRRAGVYSDTRRYGNAEEELKILIGMNPEYTEAMQLLGDVYYTQQRYDDAMPWYEKAYEKGLRNRYLCHLMAYLHDRKNNVDAAIPLYKEALTYDTTNVEIYQRLGELIPGQEGELYRSRSISR